MPIKTAVEVEDLNKKYEKKLRVYYRLIPDPFKISHGQLEEDEGMGFWPTLLYPDILDYVMFYPTQLGSTHLSDYKIRKLIAVINLVPSGNIFPQII